MKYYFEVANIIRKYFIIVTVRITAHISEEPITSTNINNFGKVIVKKNDTRIHRMYLEISKIILRPRMYWTMRLCRCFKVIWDHCSCTVLDHDRYCNQHPCRQFSNFTSSADSKMAGSQTKTRLLDKFRGCMIGAVLGDCLGAPLECQHWEGIDFAHVKRQFHKYEFEGQKPEPKIRPYTDDTAMARQVADSLISKRGMDPRDMAQRFVKEYTKEPKRGYGASVGTVFKRLRETDCVDPFEPASKQFDGKGSYGNGAGMRIHPIALFYANKDLDDVHDMAMQCARITHAHPDGINGGVLQASAVHMALRDLSRFDMLSDLTNIADNFEKDQPGDTDTYASRIDFMTECLDAKDDAKAAQLGNDIAALKSVPTAIYSFLRSLEEVERLQTENRFERTLQLAISFGGDTDTIASMAGAIAGAFVGEEQIPPHLMKQCEGVDNARRQADQLFNMVEEKRTEKENKE